MIGVDLQPKGHLLVGIDGDLFAGFHALDVDAPSGVDAVRDALYGALQARQWRGLIRVLLRRSEGGSGNTMLCSGIRRGTLGKAAGSGVSRWSASYRQRAYRTSTYSRGSLGISNYALYARCRQQPDFLRSV